MTRLVLESPAKLNLMLHITGRRDDGYHLLQTVFQFVSLSDRLVFEHLSTTKIVRTTDSPVAETDDILLQAARLLQSRYKVKQGVEIGVEKKIPVGGGLGGGSSNAASCLLAMNRLWDLKLSLAELARIGLELGADVPIFVHGNAAWAEGVGEDFSAIKLDEPWYLIVHPGIAVSTTDIFNAEQLTRNSDAITIRGFLEGRGINVCEPVARLRYPQIGQAIDWLSQFGEARMTGTGACIFAAFDSPEAAESVKSQTPAPWQSYVARGLNRNPVHAQCGISENGT